MYENIKNVWFKLKKGLIKLPELVVQILRIIWEIPYTLNYNACTIYKYNEYGYISHIAGNDNRVNDVLYEERLVEYFE